MTAKETKGVYFSELIVENIKCFRGQHSLSFQDQQKGAWKQWTVILGDNGVGKTTLLKCLASMAVEPKVSSKGTTIYTFTNNSLFSLNEDSFTKSILDGDVFNITGRFEGDDLNADAQMKKEISFSFNGDKDVPIIYSAHNEFAKRVVIYSYGANRKMGHASLTNDFLKKGTATLFFEHETLINGEEWLLQLDYSASKESDVKDLAIKRRDQVKSVLINILPDVSDIEISNPTVDSFKPRVAFKTDFGLIRLDQLSLGYRTMIGWIMDLAARMFDRYPNSHNPLSEPAIVLVDEIDLHLHPKWQRDIFTYLSERFPATQFIVTAHSPLIVQAAPEDVNLVVLQKVGGTILINQEVENVRKWRVDQILVSDLFGLESVRNPDITAQLEERVKLVSKTFLSPEEQVRLKELDALANSLPTADSATDIEAMEIIRKAAAYLKEKKDTEL